MSELPEDALETGHGAPGRVFWALGLMSGTSMDGIDLAMVQTDGHAVLAFGPAGSAAYPPPTRAALDEAVRAGAALPKGQQPEGILSALWEETGRLVTQAHADAIKGFLAGQSESRPELIGFHGQTVLHRPGDRLTVQLGDGAALAGATGLPVVNRFRDADVAAGGQGAPFAPLYHQALCRFSGLERPVVVVNIGGVANVTWIGTGEDPSDLMAFDCGPGNGPIDDWVREKTGAAMDRDGALARQGQVQKDVLARMMAQPFFDQPPPKSLDRLDFGLEALDGIGPADGAATLTAFTAEAIARAADHLPGTPHAWIICGGGRHNPALMDALSTRLHQPVQTAEAAGWRGDDLEAEAFGFLAVRSLKGLPLSVPGTTGVPHPCLGGILARPGVHPKG